MSQSRAFTLQRLWLPLLLACAAGGAHADVCRAAPVGTGDGSAWDKTMALQTALGTASCTEIWLKQGVYKPGTQRADSFNIPRPLHLYGGFAGNETERNQRAANSRLTVLSGDIDGNDIATDNIVLGTNGIQGGNSYHVLRINQAGAAIAFTPANTVIDGLTITGGQADGSGWEGDGAGLLCLAVNANRECSPRIANVTFSGNLAANSGGGMYTFAKDDGKSSPEITHSTFSGNTAGWYGGGLTVDIVILSNATGSPSIAHSTFSGNAATGTNTMGGAVHLVGTTAASVAHVTFANNTSSSFGGALHAQDGTQATITASIFWGNTASYGNQISLQGASTNLGDLTGSLVQGGSGDVYAWGGALFSGNPFVFNPNLDPLQDNGGPTWTMLLPNGSAARNKATCAVGETDQRGAARPTAAGACDLGAVERMDTAPLSPVTFTASTDQVRQIALSWAASPESVYYRVTKVVGGATVCQTASTACLLTGLPDGDSVDFHLTGYSDAGSGLLATASGQTLALPATPAGFTATPSAPGTLTLAWSAAAGADSYVVTHATGGGTEVCNVSALGCTVSGLADGTAHTFALVARNAAGESAVAATASGSTFGLPAVPTGLIAAPGDGSVRLQWAAPADDGGSTVTGYAVTMDGQPASCTASPCQIDSLANGTAFGFEVRAVNAVGPGAPAQASATPGPLGHPALPLPGGGTAEVAISGNPPGCTLGSLTIDDNAPPGAPAGATHPLGVLHFTASGCAGAALAVQVTYPAGRLAGLKPYKFGPPQQGASAAWFPYGTVTGDTVAYTVQDDGTGDNDTATPGAIADPFMPLALPAGAAAIPTLSQWGLLLLSVLLGLAALRRRV